MDYLELANLADEIQLRIDEAPSSHENVLGWIREAEEPCNALAEKIGYEQTPLCFYREHSSKGVSLHARPHEKTIMRTHDPITAKTVNLILGVKFDGEPWWRGCGSNNGTVACDLLEDHRLEAKLSLKRWARWARAQAPVEPEPTQPTGSVLLTPLEKKAFDVLKGKAMTGEQLAAACECERERLYKPKGKSLMDRLRHELKLIDNKRGVGFYRPDAPPPELVHKLDTN